MGRRGSASTRAHRWSGPLAVARPVQDDGGNGKAPPGIDRVFTGRITIAPVSRQRAVATQEQIYAELGKQLGVDPKLLREKLPQIAEEIKKAPDANSYVRAGAAYVSKDYSEAERLAVQAAEEARKTPKADSHEAVDALQLAGSSAEKREQLDSALKHYREAEKLTDQKRDPENWAETRNAIAGVAKDLEQKDAQKLDYNKSVSDLKQ